MDVSGSASSIKVFTRMRTNIILAAIVVFFLVEVILISGASASNIAFYSDYKSISYTGKMEGGLYYYASALEAQGHSVDQISRPFSSDRLENYDALLIIALENSLPSSEKKVINDFVKIQNKGLLMCGGKAELVNDLAEDLTGSSVGWFGDAIVCDPTNYVYFPKWIKIRNFETHPITENVEQIIIYKGSYIPMASAEGPITGVAYSDDDSWLDEDGDYVYDTGESCGQQPVIACSTVDKIVIIPDRNIFDNSDTDRDGIVAFNEYDNGVLGLNIVNWLTEKDTAPSPEIIDVSYPPELSEGETAAISVTLRNRAGKSSEGYIYVSFPEGGNIINVAGTGNANENYPPGSTIWGVDGQMTSIYPLAELYAPEWDSEQEETLTINVEPAVGSEKIIFLVRAALKNNATDDYERDPTSSGKPDQQGWNAYEYGIPISLPDSEELKFRGIILEEGPFTSYYSFDVEITEILNDPTGELAAGDVIFVTGHRSGLALVDSVTVGDEVEVFGKYLGDDVFLSDIDDAASDHHLKKINKYGSLKVSISPSDVTAYAKWQLTEGPDTTWHSSGQTVTKIPVGDYTIRFNDVSGWARPSDQTVSIKKGFNPVFASYEKEIQTGDLTVTINPEEVRTEAKWQLTEGPDTEWHESEETVTEIPVGDYTIRFNDVSGWTRPSDTPVTVNEGPNSASASYEKEIQTGNITVTINPEEVRTEAKWQLTEGPDTAWHSSGQTVTEIPVGDYTIRFNDVSGWKTPSDAPVTVNEGQKTTSASYEAVIETGDLTVTINPEDVRTEAKWQLTEGPNTTWHSSDQTITEIPVGDYTIRFNDVSGWKTPSDAPVTVNEGQKTTSASYEAVIETGDLTVTINPEDVRTEAKWKLTEGPDTTWHSSEQTVTEIPTGDCTVRFNDVSGWTRPSDQTMSIKKGSNPVSASYEAVIETGDLTVTINPEEIRTEAKWQLTEGPDTTWHSSEQTVTEIPTGDYTVRFNDVSGWTRPSDQTMSIKKGSNPVSASYEAVIETGDLTVTINPEEVRTEAKWKLTEGPDTEWHSSDQTVTEIPVGDYTIRFNNVSGWKTPPDTPVTIYEGSKSVPYNYTNEEDVNASLISIYYFPTETYEPGDRIQPVMWVSNTGSQTHEFFVSMHIENQAYPESQYTVYEAIELDAGKSGSVKPDWVVPSEILNGLYRVTFVLWKEKTDSGFEGKLKEQNFDPIKIENGSSGDKPDNSDDDSSGGGGSGSGGGGGGGGSPEPASNVEVKELSQEFISNGNPVKFSFPQNVTCITSVNFDSRRTLGKITTIVELLKGKSTLVPALPPGLLYKNFNIWVGNSGTASSKNIENELVGFKVEKAWLSSTGSDASTIRLWRYNETWEELSSRQIGEDALYSYYEAETHGFSPFAITALVEEASSLKMPIEEDGMPPFLGEDPNMTKMSPFGGKLSGEEGALVSGSANEGAVGVKPAKVFISIGLLSLMCFVAYMLSQKRN